MNYFSLYYLLILFFLVVSFYFFFNDTATTEIYTLSLHDALPISVWRSRSGCPRAAGDSRRNRGRDRKSTRLNSSHSQISYAVFCLKKKNKINANVKHPRQKSKEIMNKTVLLLL